MTVPVNIAFYVSGHGFGHASRDIELANTLASRRPGLTIHFRTTAAQWLFDLTATGSTVYHRAEVDTGVSQIDSLHVDEAQTVRRANDFYGTFDDRVSHEAAWLRDVGAGLVIGDIPPLAFAAAARAGIPSVAIGNFTWDWIYDGYEVFAREAPHVVPTIHAANALATRTLRLPLHGGFKGLDAIDIPFIARRSARSGDDTRAALGIRADRPVVLASFGAYGATLPAERVAANERLTVIETRVSHVDPAESRGADGRLLRFGEHELYDRGVRYEDLVAAADVVLTKPGYGIVSECIANGTALLYTSRGRFVEYDVFVAEMPRLLRCRFLPRDDLVEGRWAPAVEALLAQPPVPQPPTNGAGVAADVILGML